MDERTFLQTLPQLLDFLHITDLFQLHVTSRRVGWLLSKRRRFTSLEVHSWDSSASQEDGVFGTWLVEQAAEGKTPSLIRNHFREHCDKVGVYDQTELGAIEKKFLSQLASLTFLKICKFNFNLIGFERLVTLRLGLDSAHCVGCSTFRLPAPHLPNLRTLDLTGFPISTDATETSFGDSAPFVLWLGSLLQSVDALHWLRINCSEYVPRESRATDSLISEISACTWNCSSVFFLEIHGPEVFGEFLLRPQKKPFQSLHTFTFGAQITPAMLSLLPVTLVHLVLTKFSLPDPAAAWFEQLVSCLQILVLRIPGKATFHFDSLLHVLVATAHQLDRFEVEVVMDPHSAKMCPPQHTIRACATFRSRFPFNTYFRRTPFGLFMAERRSQCTDLPADLTLITSPMELFGEEMVKSFIGGGGVEELEANVLTEWSALPQLLRAKYVDLFDEFVETEIRKSDEVKKPPTSEDKPAEGYCDLAAAMASLRE